jgi:hypothetical protein
MFSPYTVVLDIDWTPVWVEELSARPELDQPEYISLSLSANSENPVAGSSIVSIQISTECSVLQSSISVFDLSGRIVEVLEFETDENGFAVCNWSTENVSSGIYLLREVSGNSDVLGLTVLK